MIIIIITILLLLFEGVAVHIEHPGNLNIVSQF